jgi:hypothetical protein
VVENNLLELLVNLLLFAENDITLALNGLGLELRVLENVGEDVDGGGDVIVEGLGVVDGVFALLFPSIPMLAAAHHPMTARTDVYAFRCPPMFSISSSSCCCVRFWVPCASISSHVQPQPLPRPLPLPCTYLEGKVLKKVRGSVGLVRLCAASSIDPHTDGRSLGPGRVLGSDLRHRVN